MSPTPQGATALHPQDSRGGDRRSLSSRACAPPKLRSLPPCGGGLGRGVSPANSVSRCPEAKRDRENPRVAPPSLTLPHKGGGNGDSAAAAPKQPQPPVPPPGNLILSEIKFC